MEKKDNRILVVDDDEAIRTLVLTIFRRRGIVADTARNGIEALERLQHCKYAVMLLDLMMPGMNGWEVLDRLSEVDPGMLPIIIVLTAGNEPRGLSAHFVAGSIRKPFDVDLLLDVVVGCVAAASAKPQLNEPPPRPGVGGG